MSKAIHALAIPKWGIEMENGTITHWHNAVGDSVNKGDELVDIEAAKIVNTLEATATGVLRRIFAEVDSQLDVGELIGIIADADASDEEIDAFVVEFNASLKGGSSAARPEAKAEATAKTAAPAPTPAAPAANGGKVRVSPPVRRRAESLGIDIATVVGTGPGGRITSDDVERAASGEADSAQADSEYEGGNYTGTKLTATQKTISSRLVECKQSVPHFYLNIDIELDNLLAKRAQINADQEQRVSINDVIVWCTARALMAVPAVNAQLVDDEIRQFEHADISVAVSTDKGLLTPIVQSVDTMEIPQVAVAIAGLADKAKSGGLSLDDISGGSFTVSNLGMFGVKTFNAIINPPQVAILALGRAQKKLVVGDDDTSRVATVVSASMSCDHRVVDGALGGQFLSALKKEIESI